MTTTILDEYIRPTLLRYIDRYHWNWSITVRIINLYYGTAYTKRELQALYRLNKEKTPPALRALETLTISTPAVILKIERALPVDG